MFGTINSPKQTALLVIALAAGAGLAGQTLRAQNKPDSSKWESEIKAFEAADKTNPPPHGAVLFIGSSSIRQWKTLAEDFQEYKVINRGFGGSQIIDSVAFADRIIIPYKPRLILLYAGDNDIAAGKSPEQTAQLEKRRGGLLEGLTRIISRHAPPAPADQSPPPAAQAFAIDWLMHPVAVNVRPVNSKEMVP